MKSTSRAPRRLVFSLVVLLLGLVAAFLFGEWRARSGPNIELSRLTSTAWQRNPMQDWTYIHPYAAYVPRPGYDARYQKSVNQFGFVSTPKMDSVAKPPGRIRIAFLGESSTAGMGVILRDVDTWPYQTWVLLRKKFPHADIEMINAAAGGYTSFESYGRLWSQVRFFAPDIVIACHGWNEMYYFDDAGPEKMLTRRWKGDGDWSFPPVSLPPRIRPFFLDRYLAWSRLYSALRAVRAARQSPAPVGEAAPTRKKDAELAKTFDPRGVEVFKQNLLLMKAACDLMHAEFYIVKQPTLITPDLPPALREERCFTWYHAFDYETHLRAWQAIYQMIDETFRASNVIDATSLSGKPDLLFDHAHLTPAGSGALAALVAEQLARTSNRWTEVKTKR